MGRRFYGLSQRIHLTTLRIGVTAKRLYTVGGEAHLELMFFPKFLTSIAVIIITMAAIVPDFDSGIGVLIHFVCFLV